MEFYNDDATFNNEAFNNDSTEFEVLPLCSSAVVEDDYDFALELRPDDEYRQTAEALAAADINDEFPCNSITTDDDNRASTHVPLFSHMTDVEHPEDDIERSSGHASVNVNNIGELDEFNSIHDDVPAEEVEMQLQLEKRMGFISSSEFSWKMGLLSKHQRWVEHSARRSSVGFMQKHMLPDRVIFDKFLTLMASGFHIRRHQKNHTCEMVRVFSMNGCRTVQWAPKVAKELANQQNQHPNHEDAHGLTHASVVGSSYDSSGFDCCIAVCGCGDDILAGNDYRITSASSSHHAPALHSPIPLAEQHILNTEEGEHLHKNSCFYNFGYQHRGIFKECDIVAVHHSTKEDPTLKGFHGTESLRCSRDVYTPGLTFSVVFRKPVSTHGIASFDIECDSEDSYYILYQGFKLLLRRGEKRKMAEMFASGSSKRNSRTDLGGAPQEPAVKTVEKQYDEEQAMGGQHSTGAHTPDMRDIFAYEASESPSGYGRHRTHSDALGGRSASVASVTDGHTGEIHRDDGPLDTFDSSNFRLFNMQSSIDRLVSSWATTYNTIAAGSSRGLKYLTNAANAERTKVESHKDPISRLFNKPSFVRIDPLRALGVGGGLFTIQRPGATLKDSGALLPPAQFLGWKSAGTQIWARLRLAGLDVKCVYSWDLRRILLKVRCPPWRLEEVAEKMHLKIRKKDGSLRVFKISRRDTYLPLDINRSSGGGARGDDSSITLFRSSERQQIINFILQSKIKDGGAELDEDTELGKFIVQRYPLHKYQRLAEIRHSWVTFWKMGFLGTVAEPWSPATSTFNNTVNMMSIGVEHFFNGLLTQPLDNVAEYFGEGVAFYFAYLSFYTRWLIVPSVLGLFVFFQQMSTNKLDNWLCIPFSISIMVWASFMLVFWRQKSSALAYRWGVLEYEVEETERPQFYGSYIYDEPTGEVRKTYPVWKRMLKYCVSVPISLCAMAVTVVVMITVFSTQDKLFNEYMAEEKLNFEPTFLSENSGGFSTNSTLGSPFTLETTAKLMKSADFWSIAILYPCMYVLLIEGMAEIFEKVAIFLNNFENHRTNTSFVNRLILKVFSFRFVTVYLPLVYYAATMPDTEAAYMRMTITIFCVMTVGTWWAVFLDVCVPALYQRLMLYHMRINVSETNRKIYRAKEFNDALARESNKSEEDDGHGVVTAEQENEPLPGSTTTTKIDKRVELLQDARSKCWEEALQPIYEVFGDYTHMIIQMGFILFFSPVFPLTPLIALLNNIVLIRFNAFKICYTRQRPVAQKASGIGVWDDVLQIMSVLGILANCALFGFLSQVMMVKLAVIGGGGVAILLFGFEHLMLFFKYWLSTSIPRIPPSVQRAQARERRSFLGDSHSPKKKARKKKQKMPRAPGGFGSPDFSPLPDDLSCYSMSPAPGVSPQVQLNELAVEGNSPGIALSCAGGNCVGEQDHEGVDDTGNYMSSFYDPEGQIHEKRESLTRNRRVSFDAQTHVGALKSSQSPYMSVCGSQSKTPPQSPSRSSIARKSITPSSPNYRRHSRSISEEIDYSFPDKVGETTDNGTVTWDSDNLGEETTDAYHSSGGDTEVHNKDDNPPSSLFDYLGGIHTDDGAASDENESLSNDNDGGLSSVGPIGSLLQYFGAAVPSYDSHEAHSPPAPPSVSPTGHRLFHQEAGNEPAPVHIHVHVHNDHEHPPSHAPAPHTHSHHESHTKSGPHSTPARAEQVSTSTTEHGIEKNSAKGKAIPEKTSTVSPKRNAKVNHILEGKSIQQRQQLAYENAIMKNKKFADGAKLSSHATHIDSHRDRAIARLGGKTHTPQGKATRPPHSITERRTKTTTHPDVEQTSHAKSANAHLHHSPNPFTYALQESHHAQEGTSFDHGEVPPATRSSPLVKKMI